MIARHPRALLLAAASRCGIGVKKTRGVKIDVHAHFYPNQEAAGRIAEAAALRQREVIDSLPGVVGPRPGRGMELRAEFSESDRRVLFAGGLPVLAGQRSKAEESAGVALVYQPTLLVRDAHPFDRGDRVPDTARPPIGEGHVRPEQDPLGAEEGDPTLQPSGRTEEAVSP